MQEISRERILLDVSSSLVLSMILTATLSVSVSQGVCVCVCVYVSVCVCGSNDFLCVYVCMLYVCRINIHVYVGIYKCTFPAHTFCNIKGTGAIST